MIVKTKKFGFFVLFSLLLVVASVSAWEDLYCGMENCGGITCGSDEMCQSSCSLGDVNGDNNINILDIVAAIAFVVDNDVPTADQACAADINSDGNVNVLDIVLLVNLIVGGVQESGDDSVVELSELKNKCSGMLDDVLAYMEVPERERSKFARYLRDKYIDCTINLEGNVVFAENDGFLKRFFDFMYLNRLSRPKLAPTLKIGDVWTKKTIPSLPDNRPDIYQCVSSELCTPSCTDGRDNERDTFKDNIPGEPLAGHSVETGCEADPGRGERELRSTPCMNWFNSDSDSGMVVADLGAKCTNELMAEFCNPWQGKVALSNLQVFGTIPINNLQLCFDDLEWCCVDIGSPAYDPVGFLNPYDGFRYCGDEYCQGWTAGINTEDPADLLSGWTLDTAESYYDCYWEDAVGTVHHDCELTGIDCDFNQQTFETVDCTQGDMAYVDGFGEVAIDWVDSTDCTYGQRTRDCPSYHWGDWDYCSGTDPTEYGTELNCQDNIDNDCDGLTDSQDDNCGICEMGSTITQPCGTTDVGLCTIGYESADCYWDGDSYDYNSWYGCNAVEPQASEICDDINNDDEDCNEYSNTADSGCGECDPGDQINQPCGTTDEGLCTFSTEYADCEFDATGGSYSDWYGCTAVEPQDNEICDDVNGDDEDCDGTANSNEADGECGVCVDAAQETQSCGYDYLGGSSYGAGDCVEGTEYKNCSWNVSISAFAWGPWHDGNGNAGVCGGSYVGPEDDVCDNGADEDCDGVSDDNCYSEFFNFFITDPSNFGDGYIGDESSITYDPLLNTNDGVGGPIVTYYSGVENKDLMFAKYVGPFDATVGTPGVGNCGFNMDFQLLGTWQCETLDESVGTDSFGSENSLVIDSAGGYHTTYTATALGSGFPSPQVTDVRYAKYIGPGLGDCYSGSNWSCTYLEEVIGVATELTAYDSPVIFLVGDVPHIVYARRDGDLDLVKHAWYVGASGNCGEGEWDCEEVVGSVNNIQRVSADYDSVNNLIHIVFQASDSFETKLVKYGFSIPGSGFWTISDLGFRGEDQMYRDRLSIKASDTSLHVAYPHRFNGTNSLVYATKGLTSVGWSLINLSQCGAYNPQIALNNQGDPRINAFSWSCSGDDFDSWYYYYLSGAWQQAQRVELGEFATYFNGKSGSITIDNNNKPHISYVFDYWGTKVLRYSTMLPA